MYTCAKNGVLETKTTPVWVRGDLGNISTESSPIALGFLAISLCTVCTEYSTYSWIWANTYDVKLNPQQIKNKSKKMRIMKIVLRVIAIAFDHKKIRYTFLIL